jgi:hypothetical protein
MTIARPGLDSAYQNRRSGAFIVLFCVGVVTCYYGYPSSHAVFDTVASWKGRYGWAFSALSAILSGALLPELLQALLFRRGSLRNLMVTVPFWGVQGLSVDALYRLQGMMFGEVNTLACLTAKVLVDQLLYTPLYAAPVAAWVYTWKDTPQRLAEPGFYRHLVVPRLFANWGVWIPTVSCVYSLPALLQIPLFAAVLCFWSLVLASLVPAPHEN